MWGIMADRDNAGSVFLPELRPSQAVIAASSARFRVVACGRRWGKTTLGLVMAAQAAAKGHRVWWVSPTYGLSFHPWRLLKKVFTGQWEHKLESERFIALPGGGTITVKSADNPDHLRGVGLDLVIVDEAAYVSRETWEAVLMPALADRRGSALLASTPNGQNWFWEAFVRGQDDALEQWQSWHAPTAGNPLIHPDEIAQAKAVLPARIFRQEYEAAFLPGGGSVFREVERMALAPSDPAPAAGHRTVMGVDFGRYHDFTALAVIDCDAEPVPSLVALERFGEAEWAVQRERIIRLAQKWQVEAILAEANAMGEPNIEALRERGLPVRAFTTTAQSKGPLIENLVKAIEESEIHIMPDPVLLNELKAYTYEVSRFTGRTSYFAPEGLHDDTVIALALAVRAIPPHLVLGII